MIRSLHSERGTYLHIIWRIRKKRTEEIRNKNLNAFARMANADLRRRRAFSFMIDDVPCGEAFNYLHAIKRTPALFGVSFNEPGTTSGKAPQASFPGLPHRMTLLPFETSGEGCTTPA